MSGVKGFAQTEVRLCFDMEDGASGSIQFHGYLREEGGLEGGKGGCHVHMTGKLSGCMGSYSNFSSSIFFHRAQ